MSSFQYYRNALSLGMLQQLQRDLDPDDPDLRVIVLAHVGPVFSAGHDLKELVCRIVMHQLFWKNGVGIFI